MTGPRRASAGGTLPAAHPDAEVVAALRAGDEPAFAALVDGWSGSMLRLAREFVPTASVAEEVVQDTWLAVVQGLDGFRGGSSLRTWVYRILVNQAKGHGTRERRSVPFASLAGGDGDPWTGAPCAPWTGWTAGTTGVPRELPEDALLSREVYDVVLGALEALPPRQRAVVALRDLDGHSAREVSALLEITGGNQRVLLHRGRTAVRAALADYRGHRDRQGYVAWSTRGA